jgi:DedD protein
MKWAFWRRRKRRAGSASRTPSTTGGSPEEGSTESRDATENLAAQIRARSRRRLIGAAVLLLGAAAILPMLLDSAPRPLPDNIPIDIPSERTAFSPRLTLPAVAEPANPPATGTSDAGDQTDEPPGAAPPHDSTVAAAEPGRRWVVQAAALSSQGAAHALADRLSKLGLAVTVSRADTPSGVLYRVRVGPFSSKDTAAKARKQLRSLGVDSSIVRLEASEQ